MQQHPCAEKNRSVPLSAAERQDALDRLLALLEDRVDLDHCRQVDDRYRRCLRWEEIDRPPLVIRVPFGKRLRGLPPPWSELPTYPWPVALEDPAAMMHNQLVNVVVPAVLFRDDNPLPIRADFGTIQTASALGAVWKQVENNPPWAESLGGVEPLARLVAARDHARIGTADVVRRSLAVMQFYREKLHTRPRLRQALQIALPDLQGPLDVAEQLWGNDVFLAFYEHPDLLQSLLHHVVEAVLALEAIYRPWTTSRLESFASPQHLWYIPGRLMIRDDAAIMLSAEMYRREVAPHDARLLKALDGGTLHFCGNGAHLLEPMLGIESAKGFDFGQSNLMDIGLIYARCKTSRTPNLNLQVGRAELFSGQARRNYPTGAVLVFESDDFQEAREAVELWSKIS
jgi:hypothetical protein